MKPRGIRYILEEKVYPNLKRKPFELTTMGTLYGFKIEATPGTHIGIVITQIESALKELKELHEGLYK